LKQAKKENQLNAPLIDNSTYALNEGGAADEKPYDKVNDYLMNPALYSIGINKTCFSKTLMM
jgi:hypothetical protein